jgi:hypothetical protein
VSAPTLADTPTKARMRELLARPNIQPLDGVLAMELAILRCGIENGCTQGALLRTLDAIEQRAVDLAGQRR